MGKMNGLVPPALGGRYIDQATLGGSHKKEENDERRRRRRKEEEKKEGGGEGRRGDEKGEKEATKGGLAQN